MATKLKRVILFGATNLGPYHLSRYNTLADREIDLIIVQTPVKEFFRPWRFDKEEARFHIEQPYKDLDGDKKRWRSLLKVTENYLKTKQPSIVITTGYNSRYTWAATTICKRLGIPSVIYLVGWEHERKRQVWKELIKRLYFQRYIDAAIVTGVRAEAYARKLGVKEAKIWKVGNVIDNDHFSRVPLAENHAAVPPQPYFLTVSRLSPEKNIPTLLDAFRNYRLAGGTWHLAIAGTGPEAEVLKKSTPHACKEYVHWLGWTDYETLPSIYRNASCFILPSMIEPWGLVANEAMAAGLPVLISQNCGCVPELCWKGVNGYQFDPKNSIHLSELMLKMTALKDVKREAMGFASQSITGNFTLQNWSFAIQDCLDSLCPNCIVDPQRELE